MSKKQAVVARSSAEAKLWSVALGICEALWLNMLPEELKTMTEMPIKIYYDNKAAINTSHNLLHHDQTKHIEVDWILSKRK